MSRPFAVVTTTPAIKLVAEGKIGYLHEFLEAKPEKAFIGFTSFLVTLLETFSIPHGSRLLGASFPLCRKFSISVSIAEVRFIIY